MKRHIARALILCLTVGMFGGTSISAFAGETEEPKSVADNLEPVLLEAESSYADTEQAVSDELITEEVFGEDGEESTDESVTEEENPTAETGLFESQLTGMALTIYEGIEQAAPTAEENHVEITMSYSGTSEQGYKAVAASYSTAMYAYQRDHQEDVCWATNKVGASVSRQTCVVDGVLTAGFTYYVSDYYTEEVGEQIADVVDEVVESCADESEYGQIKYFHDWLVDNNTYDDNADSAKSDSQEFYYDHSPVGCLIAGTGVCESYAKAFKIFCQEAEIPCVLVTNSNHEFDYVKMPDGKWYMVDCTYDDSMGTTDFFLVSNQEPYDSMHEEDTKYDYPETAGNAYVEPEKEEIPDGLADAAAEDGNWYYYEDGDVAEEMTTIAHNKYGWWYVENGVVNFDYTGFAENEYGWWYVVEGHVDFKTGGDTPTLGRLVKGTVDGVTGWWLVCQNKVTIATTIAENAYGWWRVVDGTVDFTCNSVEKNDYGWWYIRGGKVNFKFTGLAKNAYGWWRIETGKVNFKFTGIASNEYGDWYCRNGKVDFSFNGKIRYYGNIYTVKNGKVVS